jgi:hypothetical protein
VVEKLKKADEAEAPAAETETTQTLLNNYEDNHSIKIG